MNYIAAMRRTAALAFLAVFACAPSGDAGGGDDARGPARLGDYDAGSGTDRSPAVVVPADAPTVVFLGDSIGAGLHLAADLAFPAALQRQLAADGLPFRLVNASVSGDTTAGGLARLDWVLGANEPDVVVIELGGNDGLRGVALEAVESNLRSLVEGVRAAGARPLLLGVRVPTNLGEYAEELAALYPRLAEELDVPLVPYFMQGVGGVQELNLPDGLHPTPEGHARLARNVAPALGALLSEPGD